MFALSFVFLFMSVMNGSEIYFPTVSSSRGRLLLLFRSLSALRTSSKISVILLVLLSIPTGHARVDSTVDFADL